MDTVTIVHNNNLIMSASDKWRVDIMKLKPPFRSLSLSIPLDRHIVYTENHVEYTNILSNDFIEQLNKRGYKLIAKIGSGNTCTAYLSYTVDRLVTVLIRHYEVSEECMFTDDHTIRIVKSLPDYEKYLNKVYDVLYLDTPYVINDQQCNIDNFRDRPLLVLEYLPINISNYVLSLNMTQKQIVANRLVNFVLEANIYFTDYNVEYIDWYEDNIMVTFYDDNIRFKLVDIQGMNVPIGDGTITDMDLRDMVNKWIFGK